jgi:hypothetical protein
MHELEERSERTELWATVLLGVATVASAFCTYQSELWNSEQIEGMAKANIIDSESLRATGIANREAIIDAATFNNLLQAEAHGDQASVRFIIARARDEFRPFLEAWYGKRHGRELPPGTPFDDPKYREQMEREPLALRHAALTVLKRSGAANANSDRFLMRVVVLSLSLFFLGIAGQLHGRTARRLALAFAAVLLVLTLISTAILPLAPRPPPVSRNHTSSPQ